MTIFLRRCSALILAAGAMWLPSAALAQEVKPPATRPATLPQNHEYQRRLRAYIATLTEKDFDHGVTAPMGDPPGSDDPDYQYRNYILSLMGGAGPTIGSKRGVPAVNNPPKIFLLPVIEGAEKIRFPLVYPETLMQFVQWDYPGNVYRDNRALKMRCFLRAAGNLIMLDDFVEQNPQYARADWRSYQFLTSVMPYAGFKDVISPEARQAFQDGARRFAQKMIEWGPRGEEPNFDYMIPVALWYAAKVCEDPALSKQVEDFARMMYTDPKHFHPAGYFVERGGGLDTGFGGHANLFAIWAALATDWTFAKEAVAKVYRLRAHLALPEPDGTMAGPAEFNTRLCSPVTKDQWDYAWRDHGALMVTDEAAVWVKPPTAEELAGAAKNRAGEFARQIAENPIKSGNGSAETPYVYFKNEEIPPQPWRAAIFDNWFFPASVNCSYEYYRKGAYAHLMKLQNEKSPMLKLPFARGETFVRDFEKAFIIAREPGFGVILHTGPVGRQKPGDGLVPLPAPLGFGGGQLSAFWTPETGSVILGRRGGIIHQTAYDKLDEWRNWPIHAVSGVTAEGKVFSSSRIVDPVNSFQFESGFAEARVHGPMPAFKLVDDPSSTPQKPVQQMLDEPLAGEFSCTRDFVVSEKALTVSVHVKSDGKETPTELYETIPVYLKDNKAQEKVEPTRIEFQVGDAWSPAGESYSDKVNAVRLTRFEHAVVIEFKEPVRIKLSPVEWKDTVQLGFASCRNLMIDLLPRDGKPGEFREAKVAYSIKPVGK